jgi:hypothetical protein
VINNYKENDNFFITLTAGDFMWPNYYYDWSFKVPQFRYRHIIDNVIDEQVPNLKMIRSVYPGVETVAIISNPWIKNFNAFKKLTMLESQGTSHPMHVLFNFDLSSFENFIKQLPHHRHIPQVWFTPATTGTAWITYTDDNGILQKPTFTIRKEYFVDDFTQIQNFFCTNMPVELPSGISPQSNEHQLYYTDETKKIIAEIYKTDIQDYGFEF